MDEMMPETGKEIREQEEEEAKESSTRRRRSEDGEERSSGFINHFLPKLACEKEVEEERENDKDEEKRGGIISHVISNFVSPASPKAGDFSSDNGSQDLGSCGGGVMKEIISNLFHQSEDRGKQIEEEKIKDNGEGREEVQEENGHTKGGFIDSIVSHFPTSIPGIFLSFIRSIKNESDRYCSSKMKIVQNYVHI